MKTLTEEKVIVKLFVGCLLTAELKLHLSQSPLWKQATVARTQDSQDLMETHFQEKAYIGLFLKTSAISLSSLKDIENKIIQAIIHYCPDYNPDHLAPCILSQIFIK